MNERELQPGLSALDRPNSYIGRSVPRPNLARLTQGRGQYVSDVVRHLLPALPQILAQAQQPQAIGYAAYGPIQRQLTPQDVQEVVRQLLPVVPQIVASLQGQPQLQHIGLHGGFGQYGWPQFQSAFGVQPTSGQWPQRHLSQQDVAEISRQLVGLIPQVISNLQAFQQPRMN